MYSEKKLQQKAARISAEKKELSAKASHRVLLIGGRSIRPY